MSTRGSPLLAGVMVVTTSLGALLWSGLHDVVPLAQETVVRDVAGELIAIDTARYAVLAPDLLGPGPALAPNMAGDPLLDLGHGAASGRAGQDTAWLLRGTVPGEGTTYEGMATRALMDLRTLTGPAGAGPGAVLAGPEGAWRYVWPRDAAFVAVAYARTGHLDDAVAVLGFLQAQQDADGSLQARYLPTGDGGVPDERGLQEDGPGWALWAVSEVLRATPQWQRAATSAALLPLVTRSTARLLAQLDPLTGLPQPSPDYWEVAQDELTLGIAATSMTGLDWAAWLHRQGWVAAPDWRAAGVDPETLTATATRARRALVSRFGPGFARHAGGAPDAAVTFLLPPLARCPIPGADPARVRAVPQLRRQGGGVAPGAGWKHDGISWTPETALQAAAAAATGRTAESGHWLDWLEAHRTRAGSLPEKVLYDGRPAAVAPLAWTCALVLIALTEPAPAPLGCADG